MIRGSSRGLLPAQAQQEALPHRHRPPSTKTDTVNKTDTTGSALPGRKAGQHTIIMNSKELAIACARAADDAKATDIAVYDLRGLSSVTDFAVICTATSVPHLRAVLRDVDKEIGEQYEIEPVYAERTPTALWSVLDYVDVMIHVMADEMREFYGLEKLWKAENRIDWQ